MNHRSKSIAALVAVLTSIQWLSAQGDWPVSEVLEKNFVNPPDSAKPIVYRWWLKGWIDDEGIRADLDHMKNMGIPTHSFLFAGSILHGDGEGERRYLCDTSGNLTSIATFGDEVLCLSEVHSPESGALMSSIDHSHVPAVGSKIILRLRPQATR